MHDFGDAMLHAWKRVKANKGVPGVDGMGIKDFKPNVRRPTGRLWGSRWAAGCTSLSRCTRVGEPFWHRGLLLPDPGT